MDIISKVGEIIHILIEMGTSRLSEKFNNINDY